MEEEKKNGDHHIIELRVLALIWVLLLNLTIITVVASTFHFGRLNIWVAVAIATIKSSLVLMYFMHLRYERKIFTYFFLLGVLILALFIGFVFFDISYR